MKLSLPLACCLSIFYLTGQGQTTKKSFSELDVFALEYAQQPQISPDGNQIVYIRTGMDIMKDTRFNRLWIMDAGGKNHRKLTTSEANESSPRWSPDGSRIAFVSSTDQGSELFMYWVQSGQMARISQLERSPSNLSWSPDGTKIAFSMKIPEKNPVLVKSVPKPKNAKWAEAPRITNRLKHEQDGAGYIEPGFYHLFVISAEGNTPRQITNGEYHHRSKPVWSNDGKYLYYSANRHDDWEFQYINSEIYQVDIETGISTPLTDRNGPDFGCELSPDGKTIAYLGYDDRVQTYQIRNLYFMQTDGRQKRMIPLELDRSIQDITWDQEGKGLYFSYDDKGNTKIGYVTKTGKFTKITDNVSGSDISRPYSGGSYSISSNGRIAFTYGTPYLPPDVAIMSKGSAVQQLTHLNDDLLPFRQLGQVEEIWYQSTVDNRNIQGWIVKPPNFDASKKYPLIVENHGGPIANYGDRFSAEMQLLAAGGYVVFYPNPRGSTSYGETFGNLLYNNYPGDDYQDVMDGVHAVVNKGYIDAQQLFVTGGSAGGIMTAWIIGKNKEFAAAVVVKPVMNWISKTLTADNYYGYANYRYPGQPWENFENYWKFSPISLVGNIETPTMVMVGMEDLRTPLSEAKQLYHALKLRKIPTTLVEIPGAYHFISRRPSQMIVKIGHILAWFEQYRKKP